VYLSQPLYAVTADAVKVYSLDGIEAELGNVIYNKDKGILTINLEEELLSMTDYCVEITKDALAGATLNLYKELVYPFKTEQSRLEVNVKKANRSTVTMSVVNSDNKNRDMLFIITSWNGNEFADKLVVPYTSKSGTKEEIPISIKNLKGRNVEIVAWEFVSDKPVVLGKSVYKFNK